MQFWKEHPALRIVLMAVLFVLAMALVVAGWKMTGELAGLKVERIISEPTAAAIAYGLYEKTRNTKFLVFDLGGGTFDVSILELFENILEVRAVAGDNYLGGEDFTDELEKLFYEKKKIDPDKLDAKTRGLVHKAAEDCKLGFTDSTRSAFACLIDGQEENTASSCWRRSEDPSREAFPTPTSAFRISTSLSW